MLNVVDEHRIYPTTPPEHVRYRSEAEDTRRCDVKAAECINDPNLVQAGACDLAIQASYALTQSPGDSLNTLLLFLVLQSFKAMC